MNGKTIRNHNTGDWAETRRFFDVATSRFYYSLYHEIISISKKYKFYQIPPKGSNSHVFVINNFLKNFRKKLSRNELTIISAINSLRVIRNRSEYEDYPLTTSEENQYKLSFKFYYDEIMKILSRY